VWWWLLQLMSVLFQLQLALLVWDKPLAESLMVEGARLLQQLEESSSAAAEAATAAENSSQGQLITQLKLQLVMMQVCGFSCFCCSWVLEFLKVLLQVPAARCSPHSAQGSTAAS
jgi:hypothetical protein